MASKIKELNEANIDKRRLAKDLAAAQNKQNEVPEDDIDKCSKLTNLLKNKNSETEKANKEVKRLTTANKQLQENLTKANNKLVTTEAKTIRLEKQVDDLIDTCGKGQTKEDDAKKDEPAKKVSVDNKNRSEHSQAKCSFNDKGRCRNGSDCRFQHSNVVCKTFSKMHFVRILINV